MTYSLFAEFLKHIPDNYFSLGKSIELPIDKENRGKHTF